jgi:hypothetical protein
MQLKEGADSPQCALVAARLVQAVSRARQAPTFRRRRGRGDGIDPKATNNDHGRTDRSVFGRVRVLAAVAGISVPSPPHMTGRSGPRLVPAVPGSGRALYRRRPPSACETGIPA